MLGSYASTITGDAEHGFTVTNHLIDDAKATPQIVYVTPEPGSIPTPTPQIVYQPGGTTTVTVTEYVSASPEIIYVTPEPGTTPEPSGPEATATSEPGGPEATATVEPGTEITPEPTPTIPPTVTPQPGTPETPSTPVPTTSVSVMKIWDDDNDAYGKRPSNIRVTLSNGQSYNLNAGNGWSVTVNNLPAVDGNGNAIRYSWSESSVLGYTLVSTVTTGTTTIFTNRYRPTVVPPSPGTTPTPEDEPPVIIEDYDTPLGINVIINHVGDCFD